ncbi:Envelope glycoprotein gp160 [Elasticomyces elasticus]|nr:Envelope glycoprotein gp160 [Elasticomyces elasticus]
MAGLSFQVFTLAVFIVLSLDYAVRYTRARRIQRHERALPTSFKIFVGFLSLAIICILIRCSFRIDELSDGYSGPLIHNQGLFIGLEGVMIIVASFALNVAHPGPIFGLSKKIDPESIDMTVEM